MQKLGLLLLSLAGLAGCYRTAKNPFPQEGHFAPGPKPLPRLLRTSPSDLSTNVDLDELFVTMTGAPAPDSLLAAINDAISVREMPTGRNLKFHTLVSNGLEGPSDSGDHDAVIRIKLDDLSNTGDYSLSLSSLPPGVEFDGWGDPSVATGQVGIRFSTSRKPRVIGVEICQKNDGLWSLSILHSSKSKPIAADTILSSVYDTSGTLLCAPPASETMSSRHRVSFECKTPQGAQIGEIQVSGIGLENVPATGQHLRIAISASEQTRAARGCLVKRIE